MAVMDRHRVGFTLVQAATRLRTQPIVLLSSLSSQKRLASLKQDESATAEPSKPSNYAGSEQNKTNQHEGGSHGGDARRRIGSNMVDAGTTAIASLLVLGSGFALGGFIYHKFYKWLVLHKMENAFKPGDPVLELASLGKHTHQTRQQCETHWIQRDEQAKIDAIVDGTEAGHYHLLIGEKGTGKSSMLLDAMWKVNGEGVSMFEAHADLEIFRVRLGKALDFEFHEDYIGSYFSERGPRDTTALLDIERAFNKLEKVALRRRQKVGRPLVLIINAMHLLRDDDDGRDLLELLQQRAEQWAASRLATVIFNSDDYWVYERLKQLATRMEVHPVGDLSKDRAIAALKRYRESYFNEAPSPEILSSVYSKVGGRLTFLNRVAQAEDMLKMCDKIKQVEKQWFLNQCWILGAEMDDDVMDQQKYAAAAMVLAQALVEKEAEGGRSDFDQEQGHVLPSLPLHKAREIMTRSDFIRLYDHHNLFTITSDASVRADSVPMQCAFREICNEPGFKEHLDATVQRIGDIESLGRTRELVAKDLVAGGKYIFSTRKARKGQKEKGTSMSGWARKEEPGEEVVIGLEMPDDEEKGEKGEKE